MDLRIAMVGDDAPDNLESLYDWMRTVAPPEVANSARLTTTSPIGKELGALADVLTVAVGAGGAITLMAQALHGWLEQPRRSKVRVKLWVEPDGARGYEIDADRVDLAEVQSLLQSLAARSDKSR